MSCVTFTEMNVLRCLKDVHNKYIKIRYFQSKVLHKSFLETHQNQFKCLMAKGCKVVVFGKLVSFVVGLMIPSGYPTNDYVDVACRHVLLRQGVLGIRVKIMLPWDPQGKHGSMRPLPDHVSIVEPKDEVFVTNPYSEAKAQKPEI